MKRFYKFLMPLVAIVAMALPVSVMAQTTCQIKIVGEDAYADGWNDGSLAIMQGTTTVATFNASNADNDGEGPELDSTTVTVTSGVPVSFVWTSGDYDDEVTIWIYDGSGAMVYTVTQPSAGTIYTMNTPCPSCIAPTGLAMDSTSGSYDISWNAGAGSAWQIVWGTGSFNPDTVVVNTANVTTNFYTLPVTDEGQYSVYVRTDCGDDTSTWAVLHFNIGVAIMNMATTGTDTLRTCNAIIYDNGGPTGQYSSNCQSTLVILPSNFGDWVSISGTSQTEGSWDYLTIYEGVGTSGEVLFCDNTSSDNSTHTVGPFSADAFTVVFYSDGTVFYDGFQINVSCVPGPSCIRPESLTVDAITPDSVYLSWVDQIGTEWLIAYGPAGFNLDTATYESFTTTTAEIGGLTPNTLYDIYVRTLCGSDTSLFRKITVRTPCAFFDTLPYSTSFENATTGTSTTFTFGDPCWTLTTDATQYPYVYVSSSSSYAHTGGKGIYWYRSTSTGTYGTYQCLVLPGFDPSMLQANQMTLKFWAKASSSDYEPVFKVGVMTDPNNINSFTEVATVTVQGTTWTEYEAYLAPYTGTGNFVAIRANIPSSYWYAYIDDVTLDFMPACPSPVDLTVDSVSTEDIFVHWTPTGSESSWAVSINDSVVTDATDTTYVFTNLDANSLYNIKVAALCDGGDTSDVTSINVRTLAGLPISQFPYFCGFEVTDDGNEATDWVLENGANGWYVGTVTSNGGARSLYVSNDNGVTNNYTTGTASVSYAYASFQLDAGEYAYSFDWKCNGESSWDFIRVAYAPYGTTLPTSYSSWTTAATAPSGFTALDGGKLNQQTTWQTKGGTFTITTPGVYNLYFVWRNDGSGGSMPGAAIDNIQLVRNTCPAPRNLTATYVTNDSITVTWNSGGSETSWLVSNGVDEPVEVNDSTYTFTELNANTSYGIMVRAICSAEDSSMWATLGVRTACGLLSTLPFTEDFETTGNTSSSDNNFIPCWAKVNNATSTYYPYIYDNTSYNHTTGGTTGIYWYSTNSSGYGTYRMIVLPGIDTTEIPMNTVKLTFWAKPSSTSYAPVFYVGVMSEQNVDSTFQYYDTIAINHTSTEWQKYTVLFNNFTGTGNYVAIRDNSGSSYWYTYLDDITLDIIPACPAVEDITVQAGPASAMVSWNVIGNAYTGAIVEYKLDSADSWNSVTVNGVNYAALTGLDPASTYSVRVTTICGSDEGMSVSSNFNTRYFACEAFDSLNMVPFNDTIGNGTTTSTYFPSYSFYNYGLTQQIYTPDELGHAGIINSVAFHMSAVSQQRTYEIYMGHTSEATANQFLNPSDLTLVYNGGPVTMAAGAWSTFTLTTPFAYNGNDNLVVFFRDMTGSYVSGNAGYGTTGTEGVSRYVYQDGGAYTVGSTTGGNTSNFRNNLAFSGMAYTCTQQSSCAAPLPIVIGVTPYTISLAWAPGNTETAWNVYYRRVGETAFTTAATNVTTTNYTVTGLASGTNYEFMVEGVCGSDLVPSSRVEAATLCAKIASLPYEENFNSWGIGSGVLPNCWYNTGTYSTYTYIIGSQNMSGTTGGSIYMYQGSDASYTGWLIMPEVDTNTVQINQTQLVFNVKYISTSYAAPTFVVGVMSNPMDNNTFVAVDTVAVQGGIDQWEVLEVPLSSYADSGAYVAIHTLYTSGYSYFYVDNMSLEAIPTCLRPDSLTSANATTNSVDMGWNDRSSASSWVIEYGPLGFELGTGTQVVATSNPFTVTGLPAAFQGEFYVKAVCTAGDTSEFSRRSCAFSTSQVPATLPYDYDFENVTEWNNWQLSSNHATNTWYRGTDVADSGSYSMYVASSDSSYFSYNFDAVVNAAVYRDVDFGPVDSSYTLSFRARVGGTTTAAYDGLMVFLVDPSIATVASSSNITSPWGNVNDLYRIATVRLDTVWQTYEASFDTIHGVKRVAFFWFNQNTGASYDNIPQAAAVDNIHIAYSSCPRPVRLQAVTGTNTATLSWIGPASATYEVVYRHVTDTTIMTVITNTNSITLTGLLSPATYVAQVRKLCGAGDTSLYSDGIRFTTICSPITAFPWTEGFEDASTFDCWAQEGDNEWEIGTGDYSSSTGAHSGSSNALITHVNSGDATMLISPVLVLDPNTPSMLSFWHVQRVWAGDQDELRVYYRTSQTDTWHQLIEFTTDIQTWTKDSILLPTPSSTYQIAFEMTDGYGYGVAIDDITVTGAAGAGCAMPVLDSILAGETSIVMNWVGDANTYEVAAVAGNWAEPTSGTPVTGLTHTFTGLTPGTQYYIGVRAVCGEENYSDWAVTSITTAEHPCYAPSNVSATGITINGATIGWTAGEAAQTNFQIRYSTAADTTVVDVTTNPYTLTGLLPNTSYSVAVRAVCGEGNYSDWSDAYSFTTTTCQPVSGVTVSDLSQTTATVTWTAGSNSNGTYEVAYGITGTSVPNATHEIVNGTSYTITGLEEGTGYVVYVRSICAEGVFSDYTSGTNFTTEDEIGIDDVDNSRISLYPNPASSTVTLTGIEGTATVTVVDMNGREVYKANATEGRLTINVSEMSQGAYFVRITGEQVNAIRKLIVR